MANTSLVAPLRWPDTGRRVMSAAACGTAILLVAPLGIAAASALVGRSEWGLSWWWGTWRGWTLLGETLTLSAIASIIAVGVGWIIAHVASDMRRAAAFAVLVLSCLPLLLPSSLLATAWIMALGRDGVITAFLHDVLGGWPWTVYRTPVAAIVIGLRYPGIAALLLLGECRRERAAGRTDSVWGLPRTTQWLHLWLRPTLAPLGAAFIILMLLIMADHIFPSMLLIPTYGTQVLIQYNALLDASGAAALAAPIAMLGLAGGAMAGMLIWRSTSLREAAPLPPRQARFRGVVVVAGIFIIMLILPATALVARLENLETLRQAWSTTRAEFGRTVSFAMIGGLLCAVTALPLAATWLSAYQRGRHSWTPLVLVNLVVPPTLLALGMIELVRRGRLEVLDDSDLPLIAGLLCRFTPAALLVMMMSWRFIPVDAMRAATAHGVPWHRIFVFLTVPLYGPAVAWAGVLCGLLIAAELEISLMLIAPGTTTLGVRLYSMIHTAPDSIVSAAAMIVLLAIALPCLTIVALAAVAIRTSGGGARA